jgi:integrase
MAGIRIKKTKKPVVQNEDLDIVNTDMDVFSGHDKGLDYVETKKKLTKAYGRIVSALKIGKDFFPFNEEREVRMNYVRLIYLMIAMIQLRNASRISEACSGFYQFVKDGFNKNVVVKISKSEATKYKNGKQYKTKARYRKIMFPSKWINVRAPTKELAEALKTINKKTMMKRVLDYVRYNHKINTHSLRYATINYLITEKKIPANIVSKYVGHTSLNTILTYTQNKQCDKIFDMDM